MNKAISNLLVTLLLLVICFSAEQAWAICNQQCTSKGGSYTKADGTYVIIEPSCTEVCGLDPFERELLKGLERQGGGSGGGGGAGGGGGKLKLKGRVLEDDKGKKVCQVPPKIPHKLPPGTKVIKYALRPNGVDTYPKGIEAGVKQMEALLKSVGSNITFQRVTNGQFLTVGWNDGKASGPFGVGPDARMQTNPRPSRGTLDGVTIGLRTHTVTGLELVNGDQDDIRRQFFHELMHVFGVGHIVDQSDPKNTEDVTDDNKDLGSPSSMRQKTPGEEEPTPCDALQLKSALP